MSPTHNILIPTHFFVFPQIFLTSFRFVVFVFVFEFPVSLCNSVGLSQYAQMRDERERGEAVTVFGVPPLFIMYFIPLSVVCCFASFCLFYCVWHGESRTDNGPLSFPLTFSLFVYCAFVFVPKKGFVFFCSFF